LSAMGVSCVLLTRFERIQTNEKRFTLHDRALAPSCPVRTWQD
jgi:hypothetical protein